MGELSEMTDAFLTEAFEYLDDLRESGQTNMFGARPYLIAEFSLMGDEAAAILVGMDEVVRRKLVSRRSRRCSAEGGVRDGQDHPPFHRSRRCVRTDPLPCWNGCACRPCGENGWSVAMSTKTERDRLAVLIALTTSEGESVFGEECYFTFSHIMRRTGLDRASVRNACRVLKRRGYTDFKAGLWTEDGEPAGAGYRITAAGKASLGPNVMAAIKDAADAA